MGDLTTNHCGHTHEWFRAAQADAVVARWLGPHGLDAWRIDVANMTGRHGEVDVSREVARGAPHHA